MDNCRIAIAQLNPILGDFNYNSAKINDFIKTALNKGSDIIVFPELALTGYPPEDLLLKPGFIKKAELEFRKIAENSPDITVILGVLHVSSDKLYNAAAVFRSGEIISVYHKRELPNYGVFDEKRYFNKGSSNALVNVCGLNIGLTVCEDIWVKEHAAELKESGADIIFNLSASPYHIEKYKQRFMILKERTGETGIPIIYSNITGGQDELVFDGSSAAISGRGDLVYAAGQFKEEISYVDFNMDTLLLTALKESPERLDENAEIYTALMTAVKDYVRKNRFSRIVIGLSGGIDSALTAVIASDALGSENVSCISMPSRYTSAGTKNDALKLAENLGVKFHEISIDEIFNSYNKQLEKIFTDKSSGLTEENLQSRIRGNILMAFSNKTGDIVLTTGNKSEISCGYCTLYGDTAGAFNVLKDIPKTLVYRLSEYVNREKEIIPETILTRPPSAELRENQKDSDSLPEYELLDPVLRLYIEEERSAEDIADILKLDTDLIRKVINMVDANEFKRRQSPPGAKITSRSFGKDRRFPITNRYRDNSF